MKPTQEIVREMFHYDAETGVFTRKRKARTWSGGDRKYGRVGAGRITELGYVMIGVNSLNYNAGALAWLYSYGEWPKRVKYLNGIKTDNRIANLTVGVRDKDEVHSQELTQGRLKELLHYEPETGWFTWRVNNSVASVGDRAGGYHGFGYRQIGLDYKKFLEHQLAWLYMTGDMPIFEIDHINRDRADNRWSNLREATKSDNGHNKGLSRSSSSGYPGVSAHGNRFRATITINGRTIYLGRFGTVAETRIARLFAELKYFGRFTTFEFDRDSNLPIINGRTVKVGGEPGGMSLSLENEHGVPFWIRTFDAAKSFIEYLSFVYSGEAVEANVTPED